jgi:hypothetical protein
MVLSKNNKGAEAMRRFANEERDDRGAMMGENEDGKVTKLVRGGSEGRTAAVNSEVSDGQQSILEGKIVKKRKFSTKER